MVAPCAAILDCQQTELTTRYGFPGDYQPKYDHSKHSAHEPVSKPSYPPKQQSYGSTHGIDLKATGGHVKPAYPVDPELAAAAISPYEAVIQLDNHKVVTAPFDEIDPDKVELACNDHGCALILDDGNPYNNVGPSKEVPPSYPPKNTY